MFDLKNKSAMLNAVKVFVGKIDKTLFWTKKLNKEIRNVMHIISVHYMYHIFVK